MWKCPECGSDDLNIEVVITERARLIQSGDHFETELDGGNHEWDETSPMECRDCEHQGAAGDFEIHAPGIEGTPKTSSE